MDHAEVRELLDLAAAEPDGLDRLMAGDTPEAAAIAGHLAGCPDCTGEFASLRRAAVVIRDAVRSTPSPELRERTLAFVAAVGRDRGASSPMIGAPSPIASARASARRPPLAWLAAAAATVVLAVGATAVIVGADRDARERDQAETIEALVKVTTASLRIGGESDSERVTLASASGGAASGTLIYSPRTGELLVVTSGLAEPAPGKEYRCWVEAGGERSRVGRMFFGGGLGYWVGPAPAVDGLPPDSRFGVTLVDVASDTAEGDPVLIGQG